MSGTKAGGKKARDTILKKFGANYWVNIGRRGGQVCGKKGFALMPHDKVVAAGRKGGAASKRKKNENKRTKSPFDFFDW